METRRPFHVLTYFTWSTPALWHGIRAFAREAGWMLVAPNHLHGAPVDSWKRRFDGVLFLIAEYDVFDSRKVFPGAKIVDLQKTSGLESDACCMLDHDAIGRLAADYLYELGYRHFLGITLDVDIHTLQMRLQGFESRLKELGQNPHRLASHLLWMPTPNDLIREVRKTIDAIGLPLAVFSPDDNMADLFMQAVRESGYRIPEEVAVLGSNNERGFCDTCKVPLSSIDVNFSGLGYEAAHVLDRLMRGETDVPGFVAIPPVAVEKRRSTEKLQAVDPIVRAILHYIQEHFADKITAEQVIRETRVSRSGVFEHFREVVGRSIGKEIERVRLEHAKHLLRETDDKVDVVARLSGYTNTSAFCRAFKAVAGATPSDFRRA